MSPSGTRLRFSHVDRADEPSALRFEPAACFPYIASHLGGAESPDAGLIWLSGSRGQALTDVAMKARFIRFCLTASLLSVLVPVSPAQSTAPLRRTLVSVVGDQFYINGAPTYPGRTWNGHKIEGLLMNSRMVQGIFHDLNAETIARWSYPDTGRWDEERNTREFIAAMPVWRAHGLLAFTINLQGGSPQGYSREQPWHNSAINADGSLRPDYLARLERIINRADELGMVVILGYFYFGQDERLPDEAAVIKAVDNATRWVLGHGWRNVMVEINNECNVRYDHAILRPDRVHELIEFVRNTSIGGRRLLAGTSYGGGTIPGENVARISDFILIHGNGVSEPERIREMVRQTRAVPGYRGQPIVFNEDDHFNFDQPMNNFVAAVSEYASWGYFDYRMNDEGFDEGFQSVPVNWSISSGRKRGFFGLLKEITGETGVLAQAAVTSDNQTVAQGAADEPAQGRGSVTVNRTNYQGWADSFVLNNGVAEVVIVPAIGRVMKFAFLGEENPFWEKETLLGKAPDANSKDWGNFGGDKTWPAPQADWPKITPRAWPPPVAFDSLPVAAQERNGQITLISPVDPHFGIRTYRMITLDPVAPVMKITTRYEKVTGEPMSVSVWIITQLDEPVGVYLPVPEPTLFPGGWHAQSKDLPPDLAYRDGLISLTRPKDKSTKIGSDADTMLWVGKQTMVRIDSPRDRSRRYPDNSSSAEVYTNPDPDAYVELETLGPLQLLSVGQKMEAANTYTLLRRQLADPEKDARRVLKR